MYQNNFFQKQESGNASKSFDRRLIMEEELQTPRRTDRHIVCFMNWKHILLWVTMSIAFVLFLGLLSQSLRNDSEISKAINKQNRKLSLCNHSGKLDEFKTETANDIKQMHGVVSTFKVDLAKNNNLSSSVLETLAELKRENARIAENVMGILDTVRNFTGIFCTTCPAHWMNFQNSCYFFCFESKPWKVAQKFCEDEDAHLVIVNDGIEQNFLVKHMDKEQVFWIGLTDIDKENHWIWVDNTTLTLSFWEKGEPNNVGSGEDCATLGISGKWNDLNCSKKELSICEKKC